MKSISHYCQIDVADLLDDLSDADLLAEIEERKLKYKGPITLEDIRELLLAGRANEALAMIERELAPPRRLDDEYRMAREGKHPFLRVGAS